MTLTVNGVNLMPFIAYKGLKWQRNDLDAEGAGRTMDGTMQRGRITSKSRLDITCRPLSGDELRAVMNAIYPEFVTVVYDDPMEGLVAKSMYSNNTPASCMLVKEDGTTFWTDVTFPLIER